MPRHAPLKLSLIITFLVIAATAVAAASLEDIPVVTEGDTIGIGQTRIRFQGIDAPQTDQICLDRQSQPFPCGLRRSDRRTIDAAAVEHSCAKPRDRLRDQGQHQPQRRADISHAGNAGLRQGAHCRAEWRALVLC